MTSQSQNSFWNSYDSALSSSCLNKVEQIQDCQGSDWKPINGKCYKVVTKQQTWEQARKHCKSFDGKLAEPQSSCESDLLHSYLKHVYTNYPKDKDNKNDNDRSSGEAFIGSHDQLSENTFVYASNNEPITTNLWAISEPNNHNGEEDCASLSAVYYSNGVWSDLNCDLKRWSNCEK